MQIVVRPISGIDFTLSVEDNQTVQELKENIKNKTGVPVDQMRLIHRGRQLSNETELGTRNFKELDIVFMLLRLLSCSKCPC
ncbi:hypothetical protein GCK72_025452 [Caenorhabditis remanei]|uniref:Ubiquitin-like domain-containing protein n=1 Tax=Caenorhabditis remanei TaxID=31234 RepID=E3MJI2_CAERE|nr:hypothetical protein GCK72_025452 [Caenorhabditis remanei]EFP03658.1 hypothetical protein CRE_19220 [Caenorhabditis remanei]KAF1748985.1 hypothetical protein GCK72_025452 [Caenorhabditis remanei]